MPGFRSHREGFRDPSNYRDYERPSLGRRRLRHCNRGAAGSTAHAWTAGAFIYQALTSEGLLHPFISVDQVTSGGAVNVSAHLNVTGGKIGTWTAAFGTAFSRALSSGFESSDGNIGGRAGLFGNTSFFAGAGTESRSYSHLAVLSGAAPGS